MTRTEAMAALYRSGKTFHEIGGLYGLSRERVRQLLAAAGLTRSEGGRTIAVARRAAERQALRDRRSIAAYGLPRTEARKIPKKVRAAYVYQHTYAIKRAIRWQFDIAQWWDLWRRSGKWSRRGRRSDGYVMSRIRPEGPFSPDNVCICTLREAAYFGRRLTFG